jgi:hypothetical protein
MGADLEVLAYSTRFGPEPHRVGPPPDVLHVGEHPLPNRYWGGAAVNRTQLVPYQVLLSYSSPFAKGLL